MSTLQINNNTSDELTQKKLVKAWWKKVTTNQFNKTDTKLTFPVKGVFGIPLLHSIQYAYTTITFIDEETNSPCVAVIPTVIAKCGSYLKEHGLTVEGIFRLSGSSKRISQLQALFDTPDTHYGVHLTWEGFNVHDVSNIMRRFINYLPEPVIPLKYHSLFKKTMGQEFSTSEEKIQAFQTLIDRIPLPNQFLLLYLLDLLNLFSLTSHLTRMDIPSLASLFAPGILSHPDDELNPLGYKESQVILEFLLKHQEQFHMPKKKYPFIPTECLTRPDPPPSSFPTSIMMQHSMSTPNDILYSNEKVIHPLYASPLDTHSMSSLIHSTPMNLSTTQQPPSSFYNLQSSKSMVQVKDNKFISSMEEPIPSSTSSSSSSIRRTKTLPGSSQQNKSVISFISTKRERQQSVPNASSQYQKSPPSRRWKSIRTVPVSSSSVSANNITTNMDSPIPIQ
ncbi:unnamed protein product [Cunninghamella echinulata]